MKQTVGCLATALAIGVGALGAGGTADARGANPGGYAFHFGESRGAPPMTPFRALPASRGPGRNGTVLNARKLTPGQRCLRACLRGMGSTGSLYGDVTGTQFCINSCGA